MMNLWHGNLEEVRRQGSFRAGGAVPDTHRLVGRQDRGQLTVSDEIVSPLNGIPAN